MRGSQAPCDFGCGRTVGCGSGSGVTPNSCPGTNGRPDLEASQPPPGARLSYPSILRVGKGSSSTFNALSARERFKPGHIEVHWHQWIRSVLKLSTQTTCHSDLEEGSASSLKAFPRFGFSHNTCINSYRVFSLVQGQCNRTASIWPSGVQ
jgi:hypothetical protein